MAWMSEYPLRNIPDAAESSILRRILERGGGKSVRPIKPNSFSGGCLSPFPGNVFGMSDIPRLPVKIRTDHPANRMYGSMQIPYRCNNAFRMANWQLTIP